MKCEKCQEELVGFEEFSKQEICFSCWVEMNYPDAPIEDTEV